MKILYIATLSGTINAFLVPHIQMLIDLGHKVDIACNITTPIDESLLSRGCRVFEIEFERSPLKRDNYQAYNPYSAKLRLINANLIRQVA
jgi:glycosyltransferase EpsD